MKTEMASEWTAVILTVIAVHYVQGLATRVIKQGSGSPLALTDE